jgi:endonuclease/exonuclease/phosphatase family metal-dependent hydrolase
MIRFTGEDSFNPMPLIHRTIKAATYNVHKCVGMDVRHDPERIAAVVREIGADIIGLQEVDNRSGGKRLSGQMEFIAKATGYTALAGPTIRRVNGHYGNVLLTRWPIIESREIDLNVPGREPRGAIEGLVRVRSVEVRIVVVHLGLSAAERWVQICRLAEVIRKRNSGILILLGDMNEWYPRSRGLDLLHRHLGKSNTIPSYPAWCPFLSLDRIWVRPKDCVIKVRAHTTALSRVASDHLPVVAEIHLNGGSGVR